MRNKLFPYGGIILLKRYFFSDSLVPKLGSKARPLLKFGNGHFLFHISGVVRFICAVIGLPYGIGHSEAYESHETLQNQFTTEDGKPPVSPPFVPYKGKVRKPGTGGIYRLNDHLFEGRYSPTNVQGKRGVHTVYAKTKEECETLLEQMIAEVREQIKEENRQMK